MSTTLSLGIIKKSDVISAGLITAYKGTKKATAARFGRNLLKHVAGNILAGMVDTSTLPDSLTSNLSAEEIASAGIYMADASFRKGKDLQGSAMEALEYIVGEKFAMAIVNAAFSANNELFQSTA
jgi:hypothetical protein